jgi:hypothetical protein
MDKTDVPFRLNRSQDDLVQQLGASQKVSILKARKMGFSSVALAIAVLKFIFGRNERCVSMSFDASASGKQLERAKHFVKSFEEKNGVKLPLKYNTKNEMVYEGVDQDGKTYLNTLRIGTAQSGSFGRGDDITFLHITETAFCPNMDDLLSGVVQATVNNAPIIFETTANGFNDFKEFWDRAVKCENGFKSLFYGPNWEYDTEFLEKKKAELGERLFKQEYPNTPEEAFLTTGECYFDTEALGLMLAKCANPIEFQFV